MIKLKTNQLEDFRKAMLNTTLRNPLISFPARRKTVDVVDELSSEIYERLVVDDQTISVSSITEKQLTISKQHKTDEDINWHNVFTSADKHTDNKLQTKNLSDDLDKRLTRIWRDSRLYKSEQGINPLFLALGFIAWDDKTAAGTDIIRRAPLILVPITLIKSKHPGSRKYNITYDGTTIEPNYSLGVYLNDKYAVTLPESSLDSKQEIIDYFKKTDDALSDTPLRINENDIVLDLFSHGRFSMWKDLEPVDRWPQETSIGIKSDTGTGIEYTLSDIQKQTIETPCVLPSDTSQLEAINAVLAGHNLIIQGPPGTGKSHTITNLISSLINSDKRVLFVTEKMAALDVVHKKFEELELDPLVLQLHSDKLNKATFFKKVQSSIDASRREQPETATSHNEITKLVTKLDNHDVMLHEPIGKTQKTLAKILVEYDNTDEYAELITTEIEWVDTSPAKECEILQQISTILDWVKTHGTFIDHPLHDFFPTDGLPSFPPDRKPLIQAISELTIALESLSLIWNEDALPNVKGINKFKIIWLIGFKKYKRAKLLSEEILHYYDEISKCCSTELAKLNLSSQLEICFRWNGDVNKINDIVEYYRKLYDLPQLVQKLIIDNKLNNTITDITAVEQKLKNSRNTALSRHVHNAHSTSIHYNSVEHRQDIARYKEIDQKLPKTYIANIKNHHSGSSPAKTSKFCKYIKRESIKKRQHRTIRETLEYFPQEFKDLFPVVMMSPLSVAKYLSHTDKFDVVIFDEASQIRLADAAGSILRSGQIVIVGDSKQMPPTSFFESAMNDDEEEDVMAEDGIPEERLLGNTDMLTYSTAQNITSKMLKVHYRSKFSSLIYVSNQRFYGGKLFVVPHSTERPKDGVSHIKHDEYYKSSKNPGEAKLVAEYAIEHAKTKPNLSLGIAAPNKTQTEEIEHWIEELRKDLTNEEDQFFSREDSDAFFIKNLENVQGDERDVILISVTYGYKENGRMIKNLGPINKDGGENRLNVLFTRARIECVIFSNFTGDELVGSNNPGVRILGEYIKYAETRVLEDATNMDEGEYESPFEEQVGEFLVSKGYNIGLQVGSGRYRIDIALKDPTNDYKYVLAIECDGATYHSSRTARDRDRNRQDILESRGWIVYRIWSTNWFTSVAQEKELLLEAVKAAISSRSE